MQVSDQHINQMLQNLPPEQAAQFASIIRGEVEYEVICNTQDVVEEIDVTTLDADGNEQTYKTGKRAGELKVHKEKRIVQAGTNGRVIAHIMTDGQVIPVRDENGFMWLRASRRRTDGELGFECWCGQDSRIAPNEDGIIKADGSQPSREDLLQLATNLEQNPPKYATINGERNVDEFILRKVGN
jgi:hypothetical protein